MSTDATVETHSIEDLYDLANELAESTRYDTGSVQVFRGTHPLKGDVSVVIPAFGNGFLLLPRANRV